MSERKLQPWMRREQALIWTAVAAVSLMAVGGARGSAPLTHLGTSGATRCFSQRSALSLLAPST
jgi:hypothetical protein